MASIDAVARAAGVSTATVSRALNGRSDVSPRTRERVLRIASSLGYIASASAAGLASGRTRNIGVVVSLSDRWFFSTVLASISSRLLAFGYDITLYNLTDDPTQRRAIFERSLRRGRFDGLIVLSVGLTLREQDELVSLPLPLVAIGQYDRLESLRVDDLAIGVVATEYLLSLGHRSIAHIGWTEDKDFHMATLRHRGWEQALREFGAAPRDDLYAAADFTLDDGRRAARELLAGARPSAIFAASDELAVGALAAARESGLDVPGDVSIVGVDGHELSAFFDLTTIDQFPRTQGELAADHVLLALGEEVAAPAGSLSFALVPRGSTARLARPVRPQVRRGRMP